jgi:Asp-tRNA(Asn)/Glu-tRNA(Gln) amidotransferase A subunit family amidase
VQALYAQAQSVLTAQGATVVTTNVFADSNFQSLGGYSVWGGVNLPYETYAWMQTMDPAKSPTSPAAFKTATGGLDLMAPGNPLLGSFTPTATNPDAPLVLAANAADPTVNDTASVAKFMEGRALQLAEFRRILDEFDLDGLFFPQQSSQPGLMPVGGGNGGYSSVTVSEVNLLGVPQVNLPFGYYADRTPFSVAFVGDAYTEAQLLSYAYDFESAIAGTEFARSAPTLVPEPGVGVALIGVAVLASRRRRAA